MIWMKLLIISVLSFGLINCAQSNSWRTADQSSMGISPKPEDHPEAIVQVFVARTVNWRGYFAVHPWISIKEKDANTYTTYQVIGWRARRGLNVVAIQDEEPDKRWFGAEAKLISEIRGEKAEQAIPKIKEAAASYPYPDVYRAWPGPNSNTFVSHVLRLTPELGVELPPHAIGKDWIHDANFFGISESGTGGQFSIYGVFALTAGLGDGLEINILGLNFGVDILRPALKLPLVGRIGFSDKPVFD